MRRNAVNLQILKTDKHPCDDARAGFQPALIMSFFRFNTAKLASVVVPFLSTIVKCLAACCEDYLRNLQTAKNAI